MSMIIQNKPCGTAINKGYAGSSSSLQAQDAGFVDSVASHRLSVEKGFDNFGPHAPQNVKQAWNKAAEQTGVNGLGIGSNGLMTHIPAALVIQVEQRSATGSGDVFGNSISSAKEAAAKILDRLENPIALETNSTIRSYHEQEKNFYRAFINNLDEYTSASSAAFISGYRI